MSGASVDWRLGRRPELDGLRAFAVIAVLLDHTNIFGFDGGGLGVDVFFTLSGFLITSLLVEEFADSGRVALGRFWLRRGLRLMPALWAVVLAVVLLRPLLPKETMSGVLPALLYYSNWQRAFVGDIGALGHTWSLSIEEQFYLIWPIALVAILRVGGIPWAIRTTIGAAAFVVGFREAIYQTGALSDARIYNGFDFRCDGLLIGCALSLAFHSNTVPAWVYRPRTVILALIGLAVVFLARGWWNIHFYAERTAAALATAALIAAVCKGSVPKVASVLAHPVARWVGVRSYAIYLWHYPVCLILGLAGLVAAPLEIILSVSIAGLSYIAIEAPILGLRARLRPRHAIA